MAYLPMEVLLKDIIDKEIAQDKELFDFINLEINVKYKKIKI